MSTNYRKPIHDQLITDFKLLTFANTTTTCFADVKKIYLDVPESTPACRIIPVTPAVQNLGISTDIRALGFQADIYELIENSGGQSEAEIKIDRLSNIEDIVFAYLEKSPNNMESTVSGVHIADIQIDPSNYNYEITEFGVQVILSISFNMLVEITPQNLP